MVWYLTFFLNLEIVLNLIIIQCSKPNQILFYDHNDERYYIAGIKHISIGPTHLAVLAANNLVYTMGSNLYKELVHKKSSGRFGVQMRPIYFKKDYLFNVKISAVGCGPNYTVIGYGTLQLLCNVMFPSHAQIRKSFCNLGSIQWHKVQRRRIWARGLQKWRHNRVCLSC